MEQEMHRYFPAFAEHRDFAGPQLSPKTKLFGQSSDRSCYVEQSGRCIAVLPGKIDTIFYAMDQVIWLMGSHRPPDARPESSVIVDQLIDTNARFGGAG